MRKPNFSIVILVELDLHSEQIDPVDPLKVVSNFVACPETVHFRCGYHQAIFIFNGFALFPTNGREIKLYLSIVRVLYQDRGGTSGVLIYYG